jgi:YVTN family beta-propeller protein
MQLILDTNILRHSQKSALRRRALKGHFMTHHPDPRMKGFLLPAICLLLFFFCLSNAVNRVHAQTLAYITHPGDDTVSVINTESNTVITTIPVGDGPLA